MDELMLDANAVAGMLGEVFAVEMTTAAMMCGNCGIAGPVGATHVFRGAGIVLRCPHCDNVLVKIVEAGTHVDGLRRHANAANHPHSSPEKASTISAATTGSSSPTTVRTLA